MSTDNVEASQGTRNSLEKSQTAATAISVVARQLRFTRSRRNLVFKAAGLRPRRIDLVFRIVSFLAFALVLVIPNAISIGYFGVYASDQYQSETRFTVRTSEPTRKNDGLAEASGIPAALIAQDTQIIANYVLSRAMLDRIAEQVDLRQVYGRDGIDWYARLPADASNEDLLEFWEDMSQTTLAPQSGILTIKVKAFSAEDAHRLTQIIVSASEELVNRMNARIWEDVTGAAQREVEAATTSLASARAELQGARNRAGILTVEGAATQLSALSAQLQGEKIALQGRYQSNLKVISADAPQMKVMARQIESKERQIAEIQDQIASTASLQPSLADRSSVFAQLELEQKLAEDRLGASITTLEQLQYLSQQKLLYLDPFLKPTVPDGAEYPRRYLWIGLILAATGLIYLALASLISVMRTRLD